MLTATCDQCGTAGTFLPFLAGQRVKCKACKTGWVQLPNADGTVKPAPPPPPPPPVATAVPPPPPLAWTPKHTAADNPPGDDPVKPDQPETPSEQLAAPASGLPWYLSLAASLAALGFGSAVLWMFGRQWVILAWLEPFQPAAGTIAGSVGLTVTVITLAVDHFRRARRKRNEDGYLSE